MGHMMSLAGLQLHRGGHTWGGVTWGDILPSYCELSGISLPAIWNCSMIFFICLCKLSKIWFKAIFFAIHHAGTAPCYRICLAITQKPHNHRCVTVIDRWNGSYVPAVSRAQETLSMAGLAMAWIMSQRVVLRTEVITYVCLALSCSVHDTLPMSALAC